MAAVKEWIVGVMMVLMAIAAVGSVCYVAGRASMMEEHGKLLGAVEQQKTQAQKKLDELTAKRDELQARLDKRAAEQEVTDANAKTEIARLAAELDARPIRVRYVSAPAAGGGGGSTASQTASAVIAGTAGQATSAGVLPEQNSRRLGIALNELELLSAAYNSCRAQLIPTEGNASPQGG